MNYASKSICSHQGDLVVPVMASASAICPERALGPESENLGDVECLGPHDKLTLCRRPLVPGRSQVFLGAFTDVAAWKLERGWEHNIQLL